VSVDGSCHSDNEILDFTKGGEFLRQLLKKDQLIFSSTVGKL
jgi:hypothetical protein